MSWPHLGLTTFALVSLLLMSQGRAQAQLIHEQAAWPALTYATSPCKRLPFTVTGPGRLTIRLKMNPYYHSSFTNRTEHVVQAEALPYIATSKGTTINGLPNQDPTKWFGKSVEEIQTWEFGSGKRSAEVLFCPAVMCSGSGCSQRAATAELIVDWTAANAGVTESTGANLAKNRPAKQSSSYTGSKPNGAQGAVDGVKNGEFGFHTQSEPNPWWQVDLGAVKPLTEIRIFNRLDCCPERARMIQILLSNDGANWTRVFTNNGSVFGGSDGKPLKVSLKGKSARYVRLQLAETNYFHLDEVEIY